MAREVTVNPRFGRRSWVKLWVNEWLDGTTRFEMSDAQRAFWIDLLAMAGRSRFPGIICAGQIDGQFIGYPIAKYAALMAKPINVEETFKLFERTGKIIAEITTETPVKLYKISLCNWEKFQSEYQRQKPYRLQAQLQASNSGSDNVSNTTDSETDTETDTPPLTPPQAGGTETFFEWQRQTIGVHANGKRRLFTAREKENLAGSRADEVVHLLIRKGFRARIVPR
jgi:hypothetical protein